PYNTGGSPARDGNAPMRTRPSRGGEAHPTWPARGCRVRRGVEPMAPLLALVAGLLVLTPLSLRPSPRAEAASVPPAQESYVAPSAEVFGQSAGGIPLTAYWLGSGPTVVVVQGALHGGPEANTSALTFQLRDYFASHRRLYLSGVDPNRNWDTPEWQSDAYDSDGRFVPGLGGPRPMSEPETRLFADW